MIGQNLRRLQEAGEIREVRIPQNIKSKDTAKLPCIKIAASHIYDGINNVLPLVSPMVREFSYKSDGLAVVACIKN